MIIPIRKIYDGFYKNYTKDCEECNDYYRKIGDKELCGWGVAFKYLQRTKNPRRCEVKNRTPTKDPSIRYLERIIRHQLNI